MYTTSAAPHWVGVYYVECIRRVPEGVQFQISDSEPTELSFFRFGLAYLPNGLPANNSSGWVHYAPFRGRWYVWRWLAE